MIYFKESYLTIEFDEKIHSVVMKWKHSASADEFKKGLNAGLELLMSNNLTKWLADLSEMGGIHKEEQKWAYENWFPQAMKAGLKYMAIVTPENIMTQTIVNNIMKQVEQPELSIKYFNGISAAKKWLKNQ